MFILLRLCDLAYSAVNEIFSRVSVDNLSKNQLLRKVSRCTFLAAYLRVAKHIKLKIFENIQS